ncbi:MAG: YkvA family protein [Acidobacteriota bacterium]|nr:YkvA family protein [Acidobacteriota bacterium]
MELPRFARARARRLVESPRQLLRVIERAGRKLAAAGGARSLAPVVEELRTMIELLRAWAGGTYTGVASANLLLVVGAVVYFLMPADLVPDFIPGLGFVDDVAVVTRVIGAVREELAKFRTSQAG